MILNHIVYMKSQLCDINLQFLDINFFFSELQDILLQLWREGKVRIVRLNSCNYLFILIKGWKQVFIIIHQAAYQVLCMKVLRKHNS